MKKAHSQILILNGGSSSIKFAFYNASNPLQRLFDGKLDRIGLSGASLTWVDPGAKPGVTHSVELPKRGAAPQFLVNWLTSQPRFETVVAAGHRIVHGMQHSLPARINAELLQELHQLSPQDPEHLPLEIELIEILQQGHPRLPQWVCFDTAFHHDMPRVATLLPIPRRFDAKGMRRYGFHGLSYAYLMAELVRLGEPAATEGRVILAHLGNGASLAAVRDGRSMDTSMGFTPASGMMMGTRSGDLDPGVAHFLFRTEQISDSAFYAMATRESGLLGVSETSSDMRDLLAREKSS